MIEVRTVAVSDSTFVPSPKSDSVAGLAALFPPLRWLRQYERSWISGDAIAGITLAAYAIPVSLAYASLAGLPPHYGIYCYLVGGLGYALFGTSRQLAVGPTSAISMLVGTTVAGMADGDPARWAGIAVAYGVGCGRDRRIGLAIAAERTRKLHQ